MKKAAIAISLILVVLLISARWSSKTVTATHSEDVIQTAADTSLANGLSIKGMTDRSDVIAIGSCVDTNSVWLNRTLVTLATISVAETLKGADQGAITVVLPGGIDANRKFPVAMSYAGAPRIEQGENVLLFLRANGESPGSYTVTGFSQGKFSIVKNDEGEQIVTRDLTKTVLKDNNGVRRGTTDMTPLSILKAQVKSYLRQQ